MHKSSPLISIIIPVYNGADYMREAIDSALAQTYKNIEIIVVNDGSTDNGETEKIALSYGDKIRYFYKENGGCASALNFGISQMRGEFFSWLSHDDVYLPQKVENSVRAYYDNNLDTHNTVIMCKSAVINENSKIIRTSLDKARGLINPNKMFSLLLGFGNINGCALLIPKTILNAIGPFSVEYTYILDYRYWFYITLNNFNFFETADVSVKNRRHKNQVSVKKSHLLMKELNRFFEEIIETDKVNQHHLKQLWLYCYRVGLSDNAKHIKSLIHIPFSLLAKAMCKRTIYLLLAFAKQIYRRIYGIGSFKYS